MPTPSSPLESMVSKAESLYTLPAVAMEVVRLTDSQRVDTRALKECIERDPALAAKLLKVVNSSLFGLSGKVENLTQAIALLGIKPLKLLVLGFSLPDGLLAELDTEQLSNYWRGALTRAVAARQLAETQWKTPGDDAFLVALLQDIGMLVLLQQLGSPYARFLTQVRSECGQLIELERNSLGFDHRELTIALMRKWQLPEMYIDAIVQSPTTEKTTAQALELANLLAELVDEHRLQVLPELLELGERYGGMTKDDLSKLVAEIEPQVEQLAGVLNVDLGEGDQYAQVLAEAHQKLALVAEDAAGMLMLTDDQLCDELLSETNDLERAIRDFTRVPAGPTTSEPGARSDAPQQNAPSPRGRTSTAAATQAGARQRLLAGVSKATAACRQRREPLSLLCCEAVGDETGTLLEIDAGTAVQAAVQQLVHQNQLSDEQVFRLSPTSFALVLPEVERRDAVSLAQELADHLDSDPNTGTGMAVPLQLKVGAAYIAAVPKSFDAERLVEAADGCLAAARSTGGSTTKSIEVY